MSISTLRVNDKVILTTVALSLTASVSLFGATTQHQLTDENRHLKQEVAELDSRTLDADADTTAAVDRTGELVKLLVEQDAAFESKEGFIK